MKAAFLILAALCGGCATTPEFTWALGPRESDDGHRIAVQFELRQQINERAFCALLHNSEPQNGVPFNHNYETTFNQVACGMKWGGKPWGR
jgi:hypothetical protein